MIVLDRLLEIFSGVLPSAVTLLQVAGVTTVVTAGTLSFTLPAVGYSTTATTGLAAPAIVTWACILSLLLGGLFLLFAPFLATTLLFFCRRALVASARGTGRRGGVAEACK